MVRTRLLWERCILLGILATLTLSTGMAGAVPQGWDAVTGHTAYVTGVLYVEAPEQPDLPPILYGLATYREVRLFGLWETERTSPESQDRMVFVWSEDAPDPREAPDLDPTGEFARVRDRMGATWTVYEFRYEGAGETHHAYGVRIGALHRADQASVGEDGSYNYVLVYQPDRLLSVPVAAPGPEPAPADPQDPQDPQDPTRPLPTLDETLEGVHALRRAEARERSPDDGPQVALGQGAVPKALQESDPAPPPVSLRSA